MDKEQITEYGYQKLSNELHDLTKNQRPEIVKEIDIARSYGDLKENAEYHAAKEKQAFIEAKIAELSNTIANLQILDPSSYSHDKVKFGSTITLEDLESEEEMVYTIVGQAESNPQNGLISIKTPIAKA